MDKTILVTGTMMFVVSDYLLTKNVDIFLF